MSQKWSRDRERENTCVIQKKKKKKSPVLFFSMPLLLGPKVEKCLAHLLPRPPGEDIPII